MNDLTSVCLCTFVRNEKRFNDLKKVLQSLKDRLRGPTEIVIVDDVSPYPGVEALLGSFSLEMSERGIPTVVSINSKNLGHAMSQNRSMQMANGDTIIHIEDDIVVDYDGWNQVFAKCLRDHPEVGQVVPRGSGRGEWIPRSCGYFEYAWALGGLWAVRRDIWDTVGGWATDISHQIEPDYNLRVRMAGWRLAEVPEFTMIHLGEGDEADTFSRQLQITIGVYNMLLKWNRRFFGIFDYRSIWTMSWDDFPINVAFRRQLAAWYASESNRLRELDPPTGGVRVLHLIEDFDRCHLNDDRNPPELFKFPHPHWGEYELDRIIRPRGRHREQELVSKMGNNFYFKDEPELHIQVIGLAKRFNITEWNGFDMTKIDSVKEFLKDRALDYSWECTAYPFDLTKGSIHDPR